MLAPPDASEGGGRIAMTLCVGEVAYFFPWVAFSARRISFLPNPFSRRTA